MKFDGIILKIKKSFQEKVVLLNLKVEYFFLSEVVESIRTLHPDFLKNL